MISVLVASCRQCLASRVALERPPLPEAGLAAARWTGFTTGAGAAAGVAAGFAAGAAEGFSAGFVSAATAGLSAGFAAGATVAAAGFPAGLAAGAATADFPAGAWPRAGADDSNATAAITVRGFMQQSPFVLCAGSVPPRIIKYILYQMVIVFTRVSACGRGRSRRWARRRGASRATLRSRRPAPPCAARPTRPCRSLPSPGTSS
jgi:hypothetical protein